MLWQELSVHLEQPPSWPLHFQQLEEIKRLFRLGKPESLQQMAALNEDFMLDMNTYMGMSLAEATDRLIATNDEIAHTAEETKFELPYEVRDDLDDLRDQMLSVIPLEERQALRQHKNTLKSQTEGVSVAEMILL